jgi:glycosyltransferase involved in cell wall biosynthesis
MTQAMERFESLGADSEFAVVQRRCGVRPAGVLAWAQAVGLADLTRLLANRFAGFGNADQLELSDAGELVECCYNIRLPVDRHAAAGTPADLFGRTQARLQIAAAQTLARLAAGETMFVYKAHPAPKRAQISDLFAALRRAGEAALLVVRQGGSADVECLEPGLYAGSVSAFACGDAILGDIRIDAWAALCRATWRLHAGPSRPWRRAEVQPVAEKVQPPPAQVQPTARSDNDRLAAAIRLHRGSDLAAAAAGYQAVLRAEPDHPDALHLLGLVADAQGEPARALELIGQAIAQSRSPRFFANRGLILARLGRLAESVADHRQALALRPDHAEGQLNLGHALGLAGDLSGAEAAFRAAFRLTPALSPAPAPGEPPRLLCVAADARMPGAVYRCAHLAEAAVAAGWRARWIGLSEVAEADLTGLSALLFWRAELSGPVCRMVAYARAAGIRVGLDLDDLICDPALARTDLVDGIRSTGTSETEAHAQFARVQALLRASDFATASTEELAAAMRAERVPVRVLPNGFDAATHRAARAAARARRSAPPSDVVRIGYAGGTRTHQRDVAAIAPALAAVLRARPRARLVLFRRPAGEPMLALEELPSLAALADRIEWRDLVPLRDLPAELARFDVNIAPVETGNRFAEAKSELKFFEAALVGVPTIASPTGPFRRAIRDGQTGLLADTPAAWEAALLALIDDPAARARLAGAAYDDVLQQFGPQRRAILVGALIADLAGATP